MITNTAVVGGFEAAIGELHASIQTQPANTFLLIEGIDLLVQERAMFALFMDLMMTPQIPVITTFSSMTKFTMGLVHLSHYSMQVSYLTSGWLKDVHGKASNEKGKEVLFRAVDQLLTMPAYYGLQVV